MTKKFAAMHTGPCIGGPHKGKRLAALGTDYEVALMSTPPIVVTELGEGLTPQCEWYEIRRGRYFWQDGAWWWRGWERSTDGRQRREDS